MRKAYVIADCLSDDNKREIEKTAGECGFEAAFFETEEDASGKVSDAEVIYCNSPALFGEMPGLRWCHSMSAGVGHFLVSGAASSFFLPIDVILLTAFTIRNIHNAMMRKLITSERNAP